MNGCPLGGGFGSARMAHNLTHLHLVKIYTLLYYKKIYIYKQIYCESTGGLEEQVNSHCKELEHWKEQASFEKNSKQKKINKKKPFNSIPLRNLKFFGRFEFRSIVGENGHKTNRSTLIQIQLLS